MSETGHSLPRQSDCRVGQFHCQGCGAELPPKTWRGRDPQWCSERCRKAQYSDRCIECGGPTCGNDGLAKAPERCATCVMWTRDQIVEALQAWATDHDGRPPTMADARVGADGHGKLPADGSASPVHRLFGSWNAAVIAAGLRPNMDKSRATSEAMADAVRAGEPVASIAERYGVTTRNVYARLQTIGMAASKIKRAA